MLREICRRGPILTLVIFLFCLFFPAIGRAEGLELTASGAVLMDASTGTILYAKDPFAKRPPASTSKILTAIVALEVGDLEDWVTVSKGAQYTEGSTINLEAGERITLENLLYGALLKSGNDACVAIAEHIGGTEPVFVELMNKKAREIGAWDSRFQNPHGLPAEGHYSTAFDLALIARYALQNREFQNMVRTRTRIIPWGNKDWNRRLENTNALLWDYKGADGVKTGTTVEAGNCLVASATRGGRQLIAVVLNSGNRWQEATALLDHGFERYTQVLLAEEGEREGEVEIIGGMVRQVPLIAARDLEVVLPKEEAPFLERVVVAPEKTEAPLYEGQSLGEIQARLHGRVLKRVPLVPEFPVQVRTPLRSFLLRVYNPILYFMEGLHLL